MYQQVFKIKRCESYTVSPKSVLKIKITRPPFLYMSIFKQRAGTNTWITFKDKL